MGICLNQDKWHSFNFQGQREEVEITRITNTYKLPSRSLYPTLPKVVSNVGENIVKHVCVCVCVCVCLFVF